MSFVLWLIKDKWEKYQVMCNIYSFNGNSASSVWQFTDEGIAINYTVCSHMERLICKIMDANPAKQQTPYPIHEDM